jgi:copper chaperone CopZ
MPSSNLTSRDSAQNAERIDDVHHMLASGIPKMLAWPGGSERPAFSRRSNSSWLVDFVTMAGMKSKLQILALTLLTLLVAGAIVYAERSRPHEITLPVKGMVCAGCEEHLREKLLDAPGVRSATPSHEAEQVTVVVAGWSQAGEAELCKIIERAGYEPGE